MSFAAGEGTRVEKPLYCVRRIKHPSSFAPRAVQSSSSSSPRLPTRGLHFVERAFSSGVILPSGCPLAHYVGK